MVPSFIRSTLSEVRMLNTTRALIDLSALRHNLAIVRSLCPGSRVMAMVTADAYGHGLLPVAKALAAADGLAVARLEEAMQLRRAGISQRILLLGSLLDAQDLRLCSERQIDVTAHDPATVDTIAAVAPTAPLRVWLKLDAGMHRLGLNAAEFDTAERRLRGHPGVLDVLHMMHFSSADDLASPANAAQVAAFRQCHGDSRAEISMANSAALISKPEDRGDWVRPGIMLYGDNPLAATHPLPLRPVMTLRARILALRTVGIGESVGYGCTWTSQRQSRVATVGIGYGDGYPRHAATGTPVQVNGRRVPVVGRVSMDSIGVDVTDCAHVRIGDEVELWGEQLPAALVAQHAGTISYELFTALSTRVPREYR
jgi:alanine racemase